MALEPMYRNVGYDLEVQLSPAVTDATVTARLYNYRGEEQTISPITGSNEGAGLYKCAVPANFAPVPGPYKWVVVATSPTAGSVTGFKFVHYDDQVLP